MSKRKKDPNGDLRFVHNKTHQKYFFAKLTAMTG